VASNFVRDWPEFPLLWARPQRQATTLLSNVVMTHNRFGITFQTENHRCFFAEYPQNVLSSFALFYQVSHVISGGGGNGRKSYDKGSVRVADRGKGKHHKS